VAHSGTRKKVFHIYTHVRHEELKHHDCKPQDFSTKTALSLERDFHTLAHSNLHLGAIKETKAAELKELLGQGMTSVAMEVAMSSTEMAVFQVTLAFTRRETTGPIGANGSLSHFFGHDQDGIDYRVDCTVSVGCELYTEEGPDATLLATPRRKMLLDGKFGHNVDAPAALKRVVCAHCADALPLSRQSFAMQQEGGADFGIVDATNATSRAVHLFFKALAEVDGLVTHRELYETCPLQAHNVYHALIIKVHTTGRQ
jgi:hypothetical protein